jgi:hypothetical protein
VRQVGNKNKCITTNVPTKQSKFKYSSKIINPSCKTVNPVWAKYHSRAAAEDKLKENKSSDYIYQDRDTCRRVQIKRLKHVKQMLDVVQKITAPLSVYVLE